MYYCACRLHKEFLRLAHILDVVFALTEQSNGSFPIHSGIHHFSESAKPLTSFMDYSWNWLQLIRKQPSYYHSNCLLFLQVHVVLPRTQDEVPAYLERILKRLSLIVLMRIVLTVLIGLMRFILVLFILMLFVGLFGFINYDFSAAPILIKQSIYLLHGKHVFIIGAHLLTMWFGNRISTICIFKYTLPECRVENSGNCALYEEHYTSLQLTAMNGQGLERIKGILSYQGIAYSYYLWIGPGLLWDDDINIKEDLG